MGSMSDLPPELSRADSTEAGDQSTQPPSATLNVKQSIDSQTVDEKLSPRQQQFSLPPLDNTPALSTTAIQADAASTVYYYPAPDMTLHPLLHSLAFPFPHSYPPTSAFQHPAYPQQQQQHLHTSNPPSYTTPPRPHHRKSNSLTQSHHGPVDPTTLRVPRIYVGNLAFSVGWQDLKDFFRNALGTVGRVDLIAHPSGRSKGCAVVEFDSIEEAGRAINELNNAEIHGRKIFIREDREGKGFGAQSAQRAAAAAQANAMAGVAGPVPNVGASGVASGYGVAGVGGMMGAGGDVYAGMYGAGPAGAAGGYMQFYVQYLQQLQHQQMRQQQQQQQQMESFLPQMSTMPPPPVQPQSSSPLPLPLQPLPVGFGGQPLPLSFAPSQSFLSPATIASYTANRPFPYSPLSPTSHSTHSTSPPPLASVPSLSGPYLSHSDPHSPRLLLSNLPYSFTRTQFYELTAQYSAVPVRCDIVLDSGTGRSRGVGVAVYGSRDECERVMDEMRGLVVGERKIHVRREEHLGG